MERTIGYIDLTGAPRARVYDPNDGTPRRVEVFGQGGKVVITAAALSNLATLARVMAEDHGDTLAESFPFPQPEKES